MSSSVLSKYDEKKDLYDLFTLKMSSLIREILASSGINIHSITQRTKDRKSLEKKLAKQNAAYLSLSEVTDISAVRITTYFEDDVDRVVEILTQEFEIDLENSVDKRTLLDPDRFGYLSTHHVASLSPGRCTYSEYRRFAGLKFEIQTRSILQHAWAEIEHDLGYKSMLEVPKEIRRRFSRLSGLLEVADSEFIAIREKLKEYGGKVLKEIGDVPQEVEINKDALLAFAQNDPSAKALDRSIVDMVGWTLEVRPDRTSIQVDILNFVGIATVADLQAALQLNYSRIISYAAALIPVLAKELPNNTVGVGVSLLYLGHILAYDQGKLLACLELLGVGEASRDNVAEKISAALMGRKSDS